MNETTVVVDVVEKMEDADDAVGQLENTREMIQVFFYYYYYFLQIYL